jgi:hypothetical protein
MTRKYSLNLLSKSNQVLISEMNSIKFFFSHQSKPQKSSKLRELHSRKNSKLNNHLNYRNKQADRNSTYLNLNKITTHHLLKKRLKQGEIAAIMTLAGL